MEHYLEIAKTYLIDYSPKIIMALALFIVGKWLARRISKLIRKMFNHNKVDETLSSFIENITYYSLFIFVLMAVASQVGIDTTSFLTILGTAGLAIGLALKDSLSNFASGVMIILFRPFKIGDVIDTGGVVGKVIEISIFNSILSTPDNKKIIVPNSTITGSVITNISGNDTRRIDYTIGIGYDDDIKLTKETLVSILESDPRTLKEPAPLVAVSELGDSSVNFVARPWVKAEDYWGVYFDLTEKIKLTFDEKGISFPFPQQDVHLYKK